MEPQRDHDPDIGVPPDETPAHDALGEGHAVAALSIGLVALGLPQAFAEEQLLLRGGRGSLKQARQLLERYAAGEPHVPEAEALLRGLLVSGRARPSPDDDVDPATRAGDPAASPDALGRPSFVGRTDAQELAEAWSRHLPAVGYSCRTGDQWACVAIAPQVETLVGVGATAWIADADAWLDQTHPEDRERLLVERFRAVEERRRFLLEYRLADREGRHRWVRDEARLEERADGTVLAHGLLLDLTDRHRSDQALSDRFERSLAQQRTQQRELRERQAFVRLLAHDLRSPLSMIRGALQTIAAHGDDLPADRRDELLLHSERASSRALDLIHQLLEVDRWTGAAGVEPRPVTLDALVARACEEADLRPDRVQVDAPVGSQATLDEVIVTRALTNLLVNADRYTPQDGRVRVRAARVGGTVIRFSVEDEGPGIPDADKDRIFRPYLTLADGTVARSLGLGLSLVRVLAELHHGMVWVEDLPETGSVFHLEVREPE